MSNIEVPDFGKRHMRRVVQLVFVIAVVVAPIGPASGQPGYPGDNEPPAPRPTRAVQQYGPYVAGDSFVVESCGFAAPSTVSKTFSGESSGTSTVGADGCSTSQVEIVAGSESGSAVGALVIATVGVPAQLTQQSCGSTVRIDGLEHDARSGRNDLVVVGDGSNGAGREVVNRIVLRCDQETARSVDGASGLLARTGGGIVGWVILAALLLTVGAIVVAFERRRLVRRAYD